MEHGTMQQVQKRMEERQMSEIRFRSKEHRQFFQEMLEKSRYKDCNHQSFSIEEGFLKVPKRTLIGWFVFRGTGTRQIA